MNKMLVNPVRHAAPDLRHPIFIHATNGVRRLSPLVKDRGVPYFHPMAHTIQDTPRIIARIRRIKGQADAV